MDRAGIHPVFGGFILGAAMPRGLFARELKEKLEPFAVVFLLPMFFTFSGLNTRLDMVSSGSLLLVADGDFLARLSAKAWLLGCGAAQWRR